MNERDGWHRLETHLYLSKPAKEREREREREREGKNEKPQEDAGGQKTG